MPAYPVYGMNTPSEDALAICHSDGNMSTSLVVTGCARQQDGDPTITRISMKDPDLTMQACASGGGRVNFGFFPYFDEFWTSDNTDALQRIYMQWGTSYFSPTILMLNGLDIPASHVLDKKDRNEYASRIILLEKI